MKHKLIGNNQEKKRLTKKLQNEIDVINERINKARQLMLDDKIDANDYNEIKKSIPTPNRLINTKQAQISLIDSKCKLYGDFGFNVLKNLEKYYETLDVKG